MNHFSQGCQDRFLGLEKGRQRPRETPGAGSSNAPLPRVAQAGPPQRAVCSARIEEVPEEEQVANTLDSLAANMAALQVQMAELKKKGF